jgi:hypothetical protein
MVGMRTMFVAKRIFPSPLVVTAPDAKTIGARLRKAFTHDAQPGLPRQVKRPDSRILHGFMKVFTFNSDTLELSAVAS